MEAQEILQLVNDAGVRLITFAYCDNSGIIRGKATHVSGLERRLTSGVGVTTAMQAMGDMDQLQALDGMGPVGEFRMVPDLNTFTLLPYAPNAPSSWWTCSPWIRNPGPPAPAISSSGR